MSRLNIRLTVGYGLIPIIAITTDMYFNCLDDKQDETKIEYSA